MTKHYTSSPPPPVRRCIFASTGKRAPEAFVGAHVTDLKVSNGVLEPVKTDNTIKMQKDSVIRQSL
jgi:hypothetical protein